MVVTLTLVIIVVMALMMTIIAPAADSDCSCRWGLQGGGGGGNVHEYVCVHAKHLSNLATLKGRVKLSDIPVAGPTPCGGPPNQWEQRGEGT